MGRKSSAKREPKKPQAAAEPGAPPNIPLLALSVIGMALAGYLAWTSFAGAEVKGCTEGAGCDLVLSSRWATLLGLPTAFWGALTYAGLAGTAIMASAGFRWRLGWSLALLGTLYSAYLTTVSLTMLGATCPYCLTSFALMTSILVLLTLQRPASEARVPWSRMLRVRGPLAVGLILFLHLNYTGVIGQPPAEENPALRALAIHLEQTGVKMYGASWCPHCQDQKALFGAAAKRLPYIECSMGATQGSPQTAVCRQEVIKTYPTWVINGKRYEEVMTPARLAELTSFDMAAAVAAAP